MRTKATVVEIHDTVAIVEARRTSACEGCHKATEGNGCSVCSLMGSEQSFRSKARNTAGARVGDEVWIESQTSRMLWYSVLVFLCPILVMLCAWGVVSLFTGNEILPVLGGALGFVGTYLGIMVYSRMIGKERCDVEITEIISQSPSENRE